MAEAEDRLSSLPELGIPLKHAARTTALSRRWAPLWLRALASSPVLDFTDHDFVNGQTPAGAAATVERCIGTHVEHRPPLEAFRVALNGTPGGGDVVGWVATAVARGTREVDVGLSPMREKGAHHLDAACFLELPGDVFLTENSLARLSLDRFSLRAVPRGAPGLAGLSTLSLSHADVTDEWVRDVVSSCRFLESLSLRSCHLLTSVSVAAGENLRRLELVRCPGLRELRVAAPGLESFAFHGDLVYMDGDENDTAVDFGALPALRDAYLSHLGFGSEEDVEAWDFAYSDLLSCISHAPILTICSVGLQHIGAQLGYLDILDIDMTNVQELQLLMTSLDKYDLEAVSNVFQRMELPLLDRLFVRLPRELSPGCVERSAAVELTGKVDDGDIDIYCDDFVLGHLRLIKVVNFRGTMLELVMVAFLMKRAPILEQLVLVTVDDGEAPGDELLEIIQGHVSAISKASPGTRVTVCRSSEDSSENAAHSRYYHEE